MLFRFLASALAFCFVFPLAFAADAETDLQKQLKDTISAGKDDAATRHKLTDLKRQLLDLIDKDIASIKTNTSISDQQRDLLTKTRQSELDCLKDSLGQMTTGLDCQQLPADTSATDSADDLKKKIKDLVSSGDPDTAKQRDLADLKRKLMNSMDQGIANLKKNANLTQGQRDALSKTNQDALDCLKDSLGQWATGVDCKPGETIQTEAGGNTLFTRSIVGAQVAAANNATPTGQLFVDFYLTAPLFGHRKDDCCKSTFERQVRHPLNTLVWAFFNPRLTSVSQSNLAIGDIASPSSSIFQTAAKSDLTKLVQTFEMEQGLEFRVPFLGPIMPDDLGVTDKPVSGYRVGLFGYSSYGVGVRINGGGPVSTVYLGNAALDQLYGAPSGTQYIAVSELTKDRFYRNFYVGLRLKTFHFNFEPTDCTDEKNPDRLPSKCGRVTNDFPGIFDVAWGQDDSVNGQRLKGGVVRIQGFYPLPFAKAVHLFGGVNLSLVHKSFVNNLQFVLAPSNITPTSAGVFQTSVNPPSRDQYRFGVGIDLIQVWKHSKQDQANQAAKTKTEEQLKKTQEENKALKEPVKPNP